MITKIIYYLFLTSCVLISFGCGQQETFYSMCLTTQGMDYHPDLNATPQCQWTDYNQVPAEWR